MSQAAQAAQRSVLTRQTLVSGAYLRSFTDLPGRPRWSRERILASMHHALRQRPVGEPVWLFAYGSLIWNPLFHYAERESAVLHGWQRRFCLHLQAGRGTQAQPGRMLALDRGGCCAGVVYRLSDDTLERELALVWIREMPYGSYNVVWEPVQLARGGTVQALVFVANPNIPQYAADAAVSSVADCIAGASGPLGSNLDYLLQLEKTLAHFDIQDDYIDALVAAVNADGSGNACGEPWQATEQPLHGLKR